jgi:orotate phosphoribosyltransferase
MKSAPDVAGKLLQIKAIKLNPQNPFTWASGIQSPIYCDNRIILSFPKVRTFVVERLAEKSKEFEPFNTVAGVATSGIAFGALLADRLDLPFVYVRDKAKGHGRQNKIEGKLRGDERVLVVEDLISTGGSCLKAVHALEDYGCEIAGVVAIFSYGFEQAKGAFAAANCKYDTLTNYDELLKEAINSNYINNSDLETLKNWRTAPQKWLV